MKYIQYDPAEFDKITVTKADDVDALKARIAELEAALGPFVDAAHFKITACTGTVIENSVWNICVSEAVLRAARAALGKKK